MANEPKMKFKTLATKTKEVENKAITETDVANYLLFNDIQLKGSCCMAYIADGGGVGFETSIDPGKLLFGVGSMEIGIGAQAKAAKGRTVVVYGGSKNLPGSKTAIACPMILNSMAGISWEGSGKLSFDVGVGVEASVGVAPSSTGTKAQTKVENGFKKSSDDEGEPPEFGVETVCLGASAKVGFEAEGGYTYDYFYAEDIYPLRYDSVVKLRDDLSKVLREGTTEGLYKLQACEFINKNPLYYSKIKLDTFFGQVSNDKIIKVLKSPLSKPKPEILEQAEIYINNLENKTAKGMNFLCISSHKPEGSAGLYGKAEVGASAVVLQGNIGAKISLGLSGSYKRSNARYQTTLETEPTMVSRSSSTPVKKPLLVHATYDSVIIYSTFSIGPNIEADATASVLNKSVSLAEKTGLDKKLEALNDKIKFKPDRLNQMRYYTAIANWARPEPSSSPITGSSIIKKSEEIKVDALQGTGYVFGQSVSVANLRKLLAEYSYSNDADNPPKSTFLSAIAASLGMDKASGPGILWKAFMEREFYEHLLEDLGLEESAVLIEATYSSNLQKLVVERSKLDGVDFFQLSKSFGKDIRNSTLTLESIRLRYRKLDSNNDDKTAFSLGFKLAGTGFKLNLDKVERAGADGIVDLCTLFIPENLKRLHNSNPAAAYEQAIAPAVLFCQ